MMRAKSKHPISSPLQQRLAGDIEALTRQHLAYIKQQPSEVKEADIYQSLLFLLEASLFKVMLEESENNQTLAAKWLGMSRATLRVKLRRHHFRLGRRKNKLICKQFSLLESTN